jgi:ABC-type dipeptide/oligopeptide/nickel transport system permease subunit
MHRKKYAILLLPFIPLCVILAIYLPQGVKNYTIAVPFIFWTVYYTWIFIEKKRKKDDIDKSCSESIDK